MPWSTRELADLTGVTLRAIRHWHDAGLLPQPARLTNGYKQYTARHLVLALRIARLTALGFSLERVAEMLGSDDRLESSLLELRGELAARITELTRIRAEVDDLIAGGAAPDMSPQALAALEVLGNDHPSRDIAILLARLLPNQDMTAFISALRDAPASFTTLNTELLRLPADATDADIEALVDRGVAALTSFLNEHARAFPRFDAGIDDHDGTDAVTDLMFEQLHPAQRRALSLLIERLPRI